MMIISWPFVEWHKEDRIHHLFGSVVDAQACPPCGTTYTGRTFATAFKWRSLPIWPDGW